MNYGKKKAAKRQKKITSKSTMQGKTYRCPFIQSITDLYCSCSSSRSSRRRSFIKKIIDDTPHVSASDVKPKAIYHFRLRR